MILTEDECFAALDDNITAIEETRACEEEWAVIVAMCRAIEAAVIAKLAQGVSVEPSQAQPPAPSDAAREYMTGYSDGREWAGATSQAQPSQAGELIARLRAGTGGGKHWMTLHTEAADAIEVLKAEVGRLNSEAAYSSEYADPEHLTFERIERAARTSFRRHQSSIRGQQLTRADSYESHLVWAAQQEAKAQLAAAQPSQAVVVEPVYQYQLANGNWIDQTKESYDYNVKHGQATVRMLYATPQAAPLYAKEQQ